jgi:hypothetical protein
MPKQKSTESRKIILKHASSTPTATDTPIELQELEREFSEALREAKIFLMQMDASIATVSGKGLFPG